MGIQVVCEEKPYRLIWDGSGHYAVLEARCGHVYPVHYDHHAPRPGCPDSPDGMLVIARREWEDRDSAEQCFRQLVQDEERYAQILW